MTFLTAGRKLSGFIMKKKIIVDKKERGTNL